MSEAEGSRLADEAGGFLEEIDGVGQCIGTDAQEILPAPFRRERSERAKSTTKGDGIFY